jgi:predicted RNA methylase
MRTAARLKLGYYPLPEAEATRIRGFLTFGPEPASVLDPCTGTGAALLTITGEANVRRYGIELDAQRAREAQGALSEVIQGNALETHCPVESFSLVYLNPPFDWEIGPGRNQRMEKIFAEHVARWVRPGGVLIMVLPFDRVNDCRTILTTQFRDKAIYRLTEPAAANYREVVLFGVRRARQERDRLSDSAVSQGQRMLADLTRRYEEIPALPDAADRTYPVPPSPSARLEYRGLPLDVIEDLLPSSPAWRQAHRVTHAPTTELVGRPLTPLHKGHLGLLTVSGCLNGCLGEGKDRHVAFWESVKVVDRIEEESDGGEIVVREKERFSQRLTLLYADGRIALLSEKPRPTAAGEAKDGECTPADGPLDLRPADS